MKRKTNGLKRVGNGNGQLDNWKWKGKQEKGEKSQKKQNRHNKNTVKQIKAEKQQKRVYIK